MHTHFIVAAASADVRAMGVICVVFSSSIYFNKRVKFILFLLFSLIPLLYENLFQRNVREKFQAGRQEEKERLGK
jgi:hypothetical protein